jgi:hypothetical protein
VLSSHIAIRRGIVARQELLNELAHGNWRRPRIKGLIDILVTVSEYLDRQGYRLGSKTAQGAKDVARLAAEYLESLRQRMGKPQAGEQESLRKRGDEACTFLELLQAEPRVSQQPEFAPVRARFHFNFASFLANECEDAENAFRHMKVALDAEPNNPHFIKNYLLAVGKEAIRQSFTMRDPARAHALVAKALQHAEDHLKRHPEDTDEVQPVIGEMRELGLDAPHPAVRAPIRLN